MGSPVTLSKLSNSLGHSFVVRIPRHQVQVSLEQQGPLAGGGGRNEERILLPGSRERTYQEARNNGSYHCTFIVGKLVTVTVACEPKVCQCMSHHAAAAAAGPSGFDHDLQAPRNEIALCVLWGDRSH